MPTSGKAPVAGATQLTFAVLGIGFVLSVVAGLVVGLVIDDLPRGLGRTVLVGMIITAVVGVVLALARSDRRPTRR